MSSKHVLYICFPTEKRENHMCMLMFELWNSWEDGKCSAVASQPRLSTRTHFQGHVFLKGPFQSESVVMLKKCEANAQKDITISLFFVERTSSYAVWILQNRRKFNKNIKIYSHRLSYILLDCAQILKGSGFFWRVRVPSVGSWGGKTGRGWVGAAEVGTTASLGMLEGGWLGESVWVLRWLHTLCWELFWLSFLSNWCWVDKTEADVRVCGYKCKGKQKSQGSNSRKKEMKRRNMKEYEKHPR